ncbi:hypothetical protein BN1708_007457 [Verticillium longisporum]|uniref:Calcineurin-like phosphoesterase domain-containing protein n=1 Tax=Verticillium longisporum TaxID=100787 RepID=A0A0G4MUE2_VERLO|nr:hypothetical protein BN1708_007457 [Verticillium longisporum]
MWPIAVASVALPVACLALRDTSGPRRPLAFGPDGTFQISILDDLHYGEAASSYGPIQDALTTKTIANLLADEPQTDFVVINGDLISRDNIFFDNTTHYIDQLVQPILDRNLTWATLHGNHDPGYNRSVEAMLAREQRWPNSRTRSMVPDPQRVGVTNYYLPIYPVDCPTGCGCAAALLLWFFDSRSGFEYQKLGPDGKRIARPNWVDTDVVDWFLAENQRIVTKFNKTIPSLSFVHIPFDAFSAVQSGPGIDPQRQPGINDMVATGQAIGYCPDGVNNGTCAYGGQDIAFMKAVTSTPGMLGLFTAHQHGDSWCYKWTADALPDYPVQPEGDGLNICFGQRTGYGGNGNWERGSRQLLLRQDQLALGELETWIRLESGEVVGAVSLNGTYGQDIYPVSPNRETFCQECNK